MKYVFQAIWTFLIFWNIGWLLTFIDRGDIWGQAISLIVCGFCGVKLIMVTRYKETKDDTSTTLD